MMTRHTRLEVTRGQAKLVNRLPGTQVLSLDIVLPLRDQAGLQDFLQEVYDPTSPIYRQFLTVPEFTERFGPTQEDYDALVAFAKASGFKVVGGSRDSMDVQVEGSVTVIEAAFNVAMRVYQHPTENRTFYAPDREPTVALGFPLWHISGLDNFSIPHPALVHRNTAPEPVATTGSGPLSSFLGSDMRAAYYGGTLTGTGQSIGLFEFYGTDLIDVNNYFKNIGQTNKVPITLISVAGASTSCQYSQLCDDAEQTIDITQAVSMAPALSALYVFVGKSDTAILGAMTTHTPLSAQLSCSWLWAPADPKTDDPYFQKMAAQGQNFFAAAGDSGTWTLTNDPFPSEDAHVVGVGGTELTTVGPAGPWASETAWPESGGGISPDDIPIPSWQTSAVSGCSGCSNTYRNGPDVSANADYSYYVCADQTTCTANLYGGTSFAAPLWAGYLALVNQQAKLKGHAVLGFLNPLIYPLGVGTSYENYFHGLPTLTPYYNLGTGWGSPNGAGLLDALSGTPLTPNFSLYAYPSAVSVVQGDTGTSTITTTLSGGFDAGIGFSATGQPSGVTVTLPPSLTSPPLPPIEIYPPGSGSVQMTMAVAASTTPGTYTITVTATGGGVTHTINITLTVTASNAKFAISSSPTSVSVAQGYSGTSTITTTVTGGFDSAITLSATGQPTGVTVSFSTNPIGAPGNGSSIMTMAVAPTTATGKYTITVTGTGGGDTLTTNVALTVIIPPNFNISPSPTSISVVQGNFGTSSITTTVSGGFNSAIALSATGQPTGVTVSFNPTSIAAPGNGNSIMTMIVTASTTTGTYPITVSGAGGGITHTTTVSLTVTSSATGFTLSASPTSISVAQGSNGTSKITSSVTGGFDSAISLSASGLPTGVTAAFSPTSITGAGSSTLTLTVAASTATGTYPITVSGVSGSDTQTTSVSLTVTPVGTPTGEFSLSASPSSLTVTWGHSGSSTITVTPASGFSSAVALTASGLPSGVTVTFAPTSVSGGSGTSTMTIAVHEGATLGAGTITITGTGGGKTYSTTIVLTVAVA